MRLEGKLTTRNDKRAPRRAPRRPFHDRRGEWRSATLFVLPVFALLLVVAVAWWQLPLAVVASYAGLSLLTFGAYALDKSAARRGAWRTAESSLHLLALAGGWPGALLAQHALRHKSAKTSFKAVFWVTVVLNVVGLLVLASPRGRGLLQALSQGVA